MDTVVFRDQGPPRTTDTPDSLPERGYVWLDLEPQETGMLNEILQRLCGKQVFELHLIDARNEEHPSSYERSEDYEILIFRGLAPSVTAKDLTTRPTTFLIFDQLLVSVRPKDSRSVAKVKESLLGNEARIPRRPIGLVHQILNTMVNRFLDLREELAAQIDLWQGRLLDPKDPFDDWMLLVAHKSDLRRLEMMCEEQEEAISKWRQETKVWIDSFLRARINDLLEHIRRVLSSTRNIEAQVEFLVQMHFSTTAHRTNEIVRVLTVVSAIFLPLTFVAGVFGMNFTYMPETEWKYGYFVALAAMFLLALALIVIFRRKRWL